MSERNFGEKAAHLGIDTLKVLVKGSRFTISRLLIPLCEKFYSEVAKPFTKDLLVPGSVALSRAIHRQGVAKDTFSRRRLLIEVSAAAGIGGAAYSQLQRGKK